MLDAGLAFLWPDGMLRHSLVGDGVTNYVVPGERYQLMSTQDGQLVMWAGTANQMRDALRAVGRDDIADDPRQRGKAMLEEANELARSEALQEGIAKLTTAEAYRRLVEREIPAAPVLTSEEVLKDPQIVHNGNVVEGSHPVYGKYRRVHPAVRFSVSANEPTSAPALYGENSAEILSELGLTAEAQATLRKNGAVTR